MSDLTAKARRAAEWFIAEGWDVRHRGERWRLYSPDFEEADIYDRKDFAGEDRLLIAYAEQEGWQDQEQEADGVEWEANQEFANVGKYLLWVLSNSATADAFYWSVNDHNARLGSGTAPTREEARRQAVEAARGMG